ncbi:putative surface layer protein [Oscillibacter valericigenes Sjm18-20]|nr:putative surface layer protein [Oscillibacter valericigenes Sjm18-20]
MKKRLTSVLLCLCMALTLLPTAVLASDTTGYNVWIGGVQVTSTNASDVLGDGTVSYSAQSGTLTLKNAAVTGAYTDGSESAAIYAGDKDADLTIVLTGDSSAVGPSASGESYGVCVHGTLTITGSGSLTATGGPATSGVSCGVYVGGALIMTGSGSLTVTGGPTVHEYSNSCGVRAFGTLTITGSGSLTATGGPTTGSNSVSYGVSGGSVNVSGGSLTATGGPSAYGSYGLSGVQGVNVSGGSLTASGGSLTAAVDSPANISCGVCSVNSDNSKVVISSGVVIATGGKVTSSKSKSYGVANIYGGATDTKIDVNNVENAVNNGLLIAKGETCAARTISACGDGSAALTGSESEKFAVWGEKDRYYVLDSRDDSSITEGTLVGHAQLTGSGLALVRDAAANSLEGMTIAGYSWTDSDSDGTYDNLTLKNVIVNAPDTSSELIAYGVKFPACDKVITIDLEGVNVVSAGTSAYSSCGLYDDNLSGSVNISGDGALVALGGPVTTGNQSCGMCFCNNFVTVSTGATVTALGGSAGISSWGVYGMNSVSLSGNVTAIGGSAGSSSGGVYGIMNSVSLSGNVTAVGGSAVSSNGVFSEDSVIISGTVTAVGGAAVTDSNGVFSASVTAAGTGATVTAMGGSAGEDSYGVYGFSNVTVNTGATVTAMGGSVGEDSCGVYSGIITISGGTMAACGNTQAMECAPDLTGYTAAHTVAVSVSGTGLDTWDKSTALTDYKYIKIVPTYTLTVALNGGSGAAVGGNYTAGTTVSINAGAKTGYRFSGWTATGGGTFANASSASTTYTMPAGTAAITANWVANSSGGSPTGGGGGSDSYTVTVLVSDNAGTVKVNASVSGGTATIAATDAQLKEIKSGTQTGTVKIDVSGTKADTVIIPAKIASSADNASGSEGLEVALSSGTVILDKSALASVADKGDMKLSVETVDNSKLTERQKATLGAQAETAFVIDVNVYAGGNRTSTFGDGKITVSVPYTLKSGENADSITVWFINDDGNIEPKTASYTDGKVTFTTEHLSKYLIADFPFTDVAESAWYYGSVAYAFDNGLFAGTSATTFSPNAAMTRRMIWMALARIDGNSPANMDAARTWAMDNAISDGSNPANPITRAQMAAILYRYAQYKGYDTTQGGMSIREFADCDRISGYALPALSWAVNAGLVQGSGNKLTPSGSATRAQAAAVLQRFCQNVAE